MLDKLTSHVAPSRARRTATGTKAAAIWLAAPGCVGSTNHATCPATNSPRAVLWDSLDAWVALVDAADGAVVAEVVVNFPISALCTRRAQRKAARVSSDRSSSEKTTSANDGPANDNDGPANDCPANDGHNVVEFFISLWVSGFSNYRNVIVEFLYRYFLTNVCRH